MPEGPSLKIIAEELQPFAGKKVLSTEGNTTQPKELLVGKKILDVFSYGKYLNFQFDTIALRIHFMLWGRYSLDEPRGERAVRLAVAIPKHTLYLYNCSVRIFETADIRADYDFRTDVMSPLWSRALALRKVKALPDERVDDILMDQQLFTGVGNIIKNEVLFRQRLLPSHLVRDLTPRALGKLVTDAHAYSQLFYGWRKKFELKKHYQIYRKGVCPNCGGKVTHMKTGKRQRLSHFCPVCQV